MKSIIGVYNAPAPHWVGDAFPVRSLFTYDTRSVPVSPFLMLDYAGPTQFAPNPGEPRGVGAHPHRGFETVTIVYAGEVAHRDSSGGGGVIGPGDVQWMTAGDGIVHEEYHSEAYSATGGPFEMVQLWVNLPAAHKRAPAAYQALRAAEIPVVKLADDAGEIRVIAGEVEGQGGAARTFSPVNVWDLRLKRDRRAALQVPEGHTLLVVALDGTLQVNDDSIVRAGQMAALTPTGQDFMLEANADAKVLVLSGQPLDEPVVGYGPFVMNSQAEIREAIHDFNSGRLGRPR